MALKRAAGPDGRAGRPPERRQVHAFQPHHRIRGARSSTPIAGTTRDVIAQPAEWQGVTFTLVDTGGMFGASEDPLHELVVEQGRRAHRDGRCDRVRRGRPRRAGARRPGDRRSAARVQASGPARRQQDRRQARAGPGGRVLPARVRAGRRDCGRARRGGRRSARRDRSRGCPASARTRARRPTSPRRPRSRSSAGRTSGSRRCSIGCCRKSDRSSATCRGRRATPWTRCCKWHQRTFRIVDTAGIRRPGRVARSGQLESVSVIAGAPRDREGRRRRAASIDSRRGRDRSGRDDRRRGREGRLRHHHRRQQVGPDEGARARTSRRSSTTSCGSR